MTIGQRIYQARINAGMSQHELEKKTGIKREYISKTETGELKNPTIKTLEKFAKGLDISLVHLLGGMESNKEVEELRKLVAYQQRKILDKIEFEKEIISIVADLMNRLNKKAKP